MMAATADDIKRLREETSCGVIDCKKALEEAKGDFNKAKELLRKRGLEMAAKKSDRLAKEGRVEAYIHNGNKIGVVVEVNCETDFVARNDAFRELVKDITQHIWRVRSVRFDVHHTSLLLLELGETRSANRRDDLLPIQV